MADANALDIIAKVGASAEACQLDAWYMDASDDDQRLPHRLDPNEACPAQRLKDIGVLFWKLDADNFQADEAYQTIRRVRGYDYEDLVDIHKDRLPDYESKIKSFYEEHIHEAEEIRFVVDGSGYFDVRDMSDRWIRIACTKGDMIALPAGIYHRFTLDTNDYIKALRLFIGYPVWTPINRPAEDHVARKDYIQAFAGSAAA